MAECNLEKFVTRCRSLPDGFVATSETNRWRLGTVLLLRRDGALAAVQKAGPDNYEFRGAWSLPGGMVRAQELGVLNKWDDAATLMRSSLAARAAVEAGIQDKDISGLRLSTGFGPIVTSYTARCMTHFTLVTVQVADAVRQINLVAADRSVQNAGWLQPPLDWETLAPANRVIVAHAFWGSMTPDQQDCATKSIACAVSKCAGWSREMEWLAAPPPWADEEDLRRWRVSWI